MQGSLMFTYSPVMSEGRRGNLKITGRAGERKGSRHGLGEQMSRRPIMGCTLQPGMSRCPAAELRRLPGSPARMEKVAEPTRKDTKCCPRKLLPRSPPRMFLLSHHVFEPVEMLLDLVERYTLSKVPAAPASLDPLLRCLSRYQWLYISSVPFFLPGSGKEKGSYEEKMLQL